MTNEMNVIDQATAPVIPAYMLPIIAEREKQDIINAETLVKLENELQTANESYFTAFAANHFKPNDATKALAIPLSIAETALTDFNKAMELLKLERDNSDATNAAKYGLADILKIEVSFIDSLLAAEAKQLESLKANFTAVFGRSIIYAKPGLTGKNLAAQSQPAANVSAAPASAVNGSNPEKLGSKRWEIYNDLLAGMNHAELLAKYPTKKKDANGIEYWDYAALNGTARTVANENGWIKQTDGSYVLTVK